MAFKPSQRRSVKAESTELDLRPIMNMMCILIPLLLKCSEFVKMTYLELNLPPLSGGGGGGGADDKPEKEKPKIGLKLVVTEKGMTIAGNSIVLAGEGGTTGPTLPKLADGKYDFRGLELKMKDIVKQINGKGFEDERTIIITAEDVIPYQAIVTAMDIITNSEFKEFSDPSSNQKVKQPWFANIGVGKIII
ncbi:MAG TPA: biopolymer transporter ExbD [bacterium]|nr:biopolymer transporter ExbD [bacterium]HNO91099.1 biopolymer transporter ExbD [bacterium]